MWLKAQRISGPTGSLVAYDLRYTKQCGLKCCRATGDQCSGGVREQLVSFFAHLADGLSFEYAAIIVIVNGWRSCQHHLIALLILTIGKDSCDHCGQVVFDLLFAAAGEQSKDWTLGIQAMAQTEGFFRLMVVVTECLHLFRGRVADVVDRVVVLVLEEVYLKGKYGKELIDITADRFDAPFLPCPYLR